MEEDIPYEKKLKLALGTIFGVQRALQWNINDGMDLSYQDYFEYMVKTYSFALDLNYEKPKIKEIVKKSNTIVDEVFKDYSHLLDTSRYLYGAGKPDAFFALGKVQKIIAPAGGTLTRFAMTSI